MRRFYFLALCLLTFLASSAQEKLSKEEKERREKNIQAGNPFKQFGYKGKVATLSKGKYLEVHDLDSIVTIGSVRFHVDKKEIVGLVYEDTTKDIYSRPIGDVPSRWLSPDPLSEEYRRWSPYTYGVDNPVRYTDPDGMSVDDVVITGKFKQEAFNQLKASSPNLNMTMTDGKVTATAVEGKTLSEAETTLLNATTDTNITVNLQTTDKTIFPTSSGMGDLQGRPEAFGGSTVNSDGSITATQTINTSVAEKTDTASGQKTGTVAQHAVIEAYIGAQNSPGAGDSIDSPAAYTAAHNQTIGIQQRSGMPINPAKAMLTPINPSAAPDKRGYKLVPQVGQPVILYKTGKK